MGRPNLAQPVTVPPLQAWPGTGISIYFAITHTPKSGLGLRQEKRDLGLQGAGGTAGVDTGRSQIHTLATQGTKGTDLVHSLSIQGDEGKPVQEVEGPKSMRAALNPTVCGGGGHTHTRICEQ